jgi:thiosulfate dehydrogenase [quinone] large subunit
VSLDSGGRNTRAIAGLRIAVGALFLIFGEYKVAGRQFVLGGGFESWIHRFLDSGSAYPFMVPVLQAFVLPHARAIAVLVAGGEVAIGIGLILGILVRVASLAGLVYMLALLFSANYPGAGSPVWAYFGAALDHLVFALCFLAFIVGAPSARWAMDLRRAPRNGTGR